MTEWPPREQRFLGTLLRGERRLRHGDYFAALCCFSEAAQLAERADREAVRGLFHAAVAAYKRQRGDERGARRQVAHARRRLAGAPPVLHGVEVAPLLARVAPEEPESDTIVPPR